MCVQTIIWLFHLCNITPNTVRDAVGGRGIAVRDSITVSVSHHLHSLHSQVYDLKTELRVEFQLQLRDGDGVHVANEVLAVVQDHLAVEAGLPHLEYLGAIEVCRHRS